MKNMTVFATLNQNRCWTLTDAAGAELQEGFEYDSRANALEAAIHLWPANSVWHGRRVRNGWRIETDDDNPEPRRKHKSGTRPDTSLYLGDHRRSWLIRQGGIQPTIHRLIDEAMSQNNKIDP